MADYKKFDQALNRFERALDLVEAELAQKRKTQAKLEQLEAQAAVLKSDKLKLDKDLAQVRIKATELVETSRQAAGKIDSAVSRIRAVLHSNS